jgi:lipid-binding SYLF domain-containing protein
MKRTKCVTVFVILAAVCLIGASWVSAESVQGQREDILQLADNTLSQLYQMVPGAREAVRDSVGYGVFSDRGLKIFMFGSGLGKGVVINNTMKKATYMVMGEVQAGLGFGISKFRQVFVFQTYDALNNFINYGFELGAQATGAAQGGSQGGSISGAINIATGVWRFQITEAGLELSLALLVPSTSRTMS